MKKRKHIILGAAIVFVLAIVALTIAFIMKKDVFDYISDADAISEMTISHQDDGISRITIDKEDYEYLTECISGYTYTKETNEETQELWEYKYTSNYTLIKVELWNYKINIVSGDKELELIFYDTFCILDGVMYAYTADSENDLEKIWSKVTENMSDYDWMMSYIGQFEEGVTEEQVWEIMGTEDVVFGSGIQYFDYHFGEYCVTIVYFPDAYVLTVYNKETGESQETTYYYDSIVR